MYDYFICMSAEVHTMIFKVKNIQEITSIRLKTYYTNNNKSFTEILILVYAYGLKGWYLVG